MSEDRPPPKSPANKNIRTIIAGIFVLLWTVVIIVDFFLFPTTDVIPFWFQATGLLVLGYLLGVSFDDLPGRGK